jgi:hypothetical protein
VVISPVRVEISSSLSVFEDRVTVLNDKLYRKVLCVHVRHLTLETCVTHDGRRKHDSQVLGRHLKVVVSN